MRPADIIPYLQAANPDCNLVVLTVREYNGLRHLATRYLKICSTCFKDRGVTNVDEEAISVVVERRDVRIPKGGMDK